MSSFIKTCVSETLLLAALAGPIVLAGGCEQQADPPVEPRALGTGAAGAGATGPTGAPQAAPQAPPTETADSGGIKHTDGAITARVKTALMGDDQVKGLGIDVDTQDAQVTLKGALETEQQVARAVEVARGVDGVRTVINRLTVKGEDKAAQSDKG
jgi:hyperosmotically inducible protein